MGTADAAAAAAAVCMCTRDEPGPASAVKAFVANMIILLPRERPAEIATSRAAAEVVVIGDGGTPRARTRKIARL